MRRSGRWGIDDEMRTFPYKRKVVGVAHTLAYVAGPTSEKAQTTFFFTKRDYKVPNQKFTRRIYKDSKGEYVIMKGDKFYIERFDLHSQERSNSNEEL